MAPSLIIPPSEPVKALAPIQLPSSPTAGGDDLHGSMFANLRQLLDRCGPDTNANDRLTVVIIALIEAGITKEGDIVGAARKLGFKPGHAGALLHRSYGNTWRRDKKGIYQLLS